MPVLDFKASLFHIYIPKIKRLSEELQVLLDNPDRRIEEIDHLFFEGMVVIQWIFENFPKHRKDVDQTIYKELKQELTDRESLFFSNCLVHFKQSDRYSQIISQEENRDYAGHCFEAAYAFMIKHHKVLQGLCLVQGWVYNSLLNKYMNHAWNEYGQEVFDLTEGSAAQSKSDYYSRKKVIESGMRSYGFQEVLAQSEQSGHYGPWDAVLFEFQLLAPDDFEALFH